MSEKPTASSAEQQTEDEVRKGVEAQAEHTDANAAESSDAGKETDANSDERSDLLGAVRDAVEPKSEQDTPESSSDSESGAEKDADAESDAEDKDDESKDAADDEADEPPFHKHPRWQEMKRQRDTFKQGHENYEQIQSFMQANSLTAEEVADGFQTMALMKTNPAEAVKRLQAYYDQMKDFRSDHMPDDIQKKVDEGLIDQETAVEFARLRAEQNSANHRSQVSQAQLQQEQERSRQQSAATQRQAMASAVGEWEQRIKQSDPEYASHKAAMVQDRVASLVNSGQAARPQSPQEATALADRALKDVNDRLRQLTPRKPESRPTPSGGPSNRTAPEPENVGDAIRQAIGRG